MRKSLKNFNPDKIAVLETRTWHAYYHHQFLKLFFLLVRLMHEFFDLNYLHAVRVAYYSASATIDFRLNKGKENQEIIQRITKKLTQFYLFISNHSLETFDHEKAAKLEIEWWLVDRYPSRYGISREEAIKMPIALIYDVDSSKLNEYAENRARAMVLQDEAEIEHREADWKRIGSLLKFAYGSLHRAVQ